MTIVDNAALIPFSLRCITNAVLDGLSILVALMNMNESLLVKQLEGWNLPDLFATMPKCLPDCPTRELLCRHIAAGLQGETSAQLMADKVKKDGEEVARGEHGRPDSRVCQDAQEGQCVAKDSSAPTPEACWTTATCRGKHYGAASSPLYTDLPPSSWCPSPDKEH